MRVYLIPHNGTPRPHDCGNGLYDLQHLVDGYIEPCAPAQLREFGIELLCNEEGLLKGLPCNENLYPFFFVGNLVAVGVGEDEFVSLTPKQEMFLRSWLTMLRLDPYYEKDRGHFD